MWRLFQKICGEEMRAVSDGNLGQRIGDASQGPCVPFGLFHVCLVQQGPDHGRDIRYEGQYDLLPRAL